MKDVFKFVFYLTMVWMFVAGLIKYNASVQPAPLRYELKFAEDGEVAVFDTATGAARQIHAGSGEQYFAPDGGAPIAPQPPVQLPVPDAPKSF